MLARSAGTKVFLAAGVTDLRRSIDGLALLVDKMTSAPKRLTSGGVPRVSLGEASAAYWLFQQPFQRGGQP